MEFVLLWSMSAVPMDNVEDALDAVSVGDFISLLTIGRSALARTVLSNGSWCSKFFAWVCACKWTVRVDWVLFEVVISDTWHGSCFIYTRWDKITERNRKKNTTRTKEAHAIKSLAFESPQKVWINSYWKHRAKQTPKIAAWKKPFAKLRESHTHTRYKPATAMSYSMKSGWCGCIQKWCRAPNERNW